VQPRYMAEIAHLLSHHAPIRAQFTPKTPPVYKLYVIERYVKVKTRFGRGASLTHFGAPTTDFSGGKEMAET